MGRPKKILPPENLDSSISTALRCSHCGGYLEIKHFYKTKLSIYKGIGVFPFCKSCLDEIYQSYYNEYSTDGLIDADKKAIERVCMMLNVYYSEKVFDGAMQKKSGFSNENTSAIACYMKQVNMIQFAKSNYDNTIREKKAETGTANVSSIADVFSTNDEILQRKLDRAKKFFGSGFTPDDYLFLQEQYEDWVTRHECQTKSQEEMFKHICYTQLDIKKGKQKGLDTKDLDATFLRQLDAAKLQPKQNKGETVSEAQTFGTLIEKWENTRPIPEIDEDLRDVDKIGLYLDVFFRGHLAKMMGLKNGVSKLYDRYMKKYTVQKPEYNDDEDGEALFDAIFGSSMDE